MSDSEAEGRVYSPVEPTQGCQAAWSAEWTCNREKGHTGQHRDKRNGSWWFAPEAPERVPPPLVVPTDAPFTDYDG